jgi:hypothetical protein
MAIGLISPCLLQAVALAMPIQNINGVAEAASKQNSNGPRRPSALNPPSASGSGGTAELTQQRGRPAPGLSAHSPNGKTLATSGANPMRVE